MKKPLLLRQVRGAAMTEYTILIGVVAITCIGAFISLGVALVVSFEARRDLILYPFP
jgi:Flp pilus assembly pilin Flp